jgi:hypothetical protein
MGRRCWGWDSKAGLRAEDWGLSIKDRGRETGDRGAVKSQIIPVRDLTGCKAKKKH